MSQRTTPKQGVTFIRNVKPTHKRTFWEKAQNGLIVGGEWLIWMLLGFIVFNLLLPIVIGA